MERLGVDTMEIARLKGHNEAKMRARMPHVHKLAASERELGLLARPWVRKSDSQIILGRDRVGARLVNGHTHVEVELVECDDTELARIRAAENAHRRHDPGEQSRALSELLAAYEQQASEELELEPPRPKHDPRNGPPRPPKTAKGIARERAAKDLGIKPESVRRAESRGKAKLAEADKPKADKIPTFGRPVDDAWMAGVELADELIGDAYNKLRAALASLGRLNSSKTPYPSAALQRLYDNVQGQLNSIKEARPVSVCPYCKLVPEVRSHCPACMTSGFITERARKTIPPELADTDTLRVAYSGRYVPITQFASQGDLMPLDAMDVEPEAMGEAGLGFDVEDL